MRRSPQMTRSAYRIAPLAGHLASFASLQMPSHPETRPARPKSSPDPLDQGGQLCLTRQRVCAATLVPLKLKEAFMVRRIGMFVAAVALLMLPAASAFGQFKQGDW